MADDVLLAEFIRHLRVERGLSRNTWLSYGYQIKGYLTFLVARGKGPLSAGRDDVLAHLEAKKDGGGRSTSIFAAVIAVRQFHRFLKDQGHAEADPTLGMRLPRFKQRLTSPLSAAEMEKLLATPAGPRFVAIRDRAMLELMYATGMRVSELTGLDLGRVDLAGAWVRLLGKGGSERFVPFGNRAKAALRSYLDVRGCRYPGPAYASPDAPFFLSHRGKRLGRCAFWLILRALARRAGIQGGAFPHQLRHGFATALLEGGAALAVVQQALGHRSISTTAIYTHVSQSFLRRTCEKAHPAFG